MAATTATEIKHGTLTGYTTQKCRCDECQKAMRDYKRAWRSGAPRTAPDRDWISDLLHELFPDGLTDDCPARRARQPAVA